MTKSLGTWDNAPLAYVLVEIRTEVISDLKDYQPKLGGEFRERFPLQREVRSAQLIASASEMVLAPQIDPMWELAAADNRTAVLLRPNGIVLHATSYVDSKDFLLKLLEVLTVYNKIVPAVFVNRLGLRYIDFILPKQAESPDLYVNAKLNCDLGVSERPDEFSATSVAVYPLKDGSLTLRFMRGRGQPELPPDLSLTALTPSHLMRDGSGKPVIPDKRPTAILDTDRVVEITPVERLDPKKIHDRVVEMHNDVSRVFGAAITNHARKAWGAKK